MATERYTCPVCGAEIEYGEGVDVERCTQCGIIVRKDNAQAFAKKVAGQNEPVNPRADRGCLVPMLVILAVIVVFLTIAILVFKSRNGG